MKKKNQLNYLAILLISFYRKIIAPYTRGNCRFVPSCSEYGLEAFKKYNFIKAIWLTVRRIIRCNPFGGKGYDPLP